MPGKLIALAGLAAVVAPVGAGWAYTADASVGDGGFGLAGLFSDEQIDEFAEDGYLITREDFGGEITITVTGPDGDEVPIGALPPEVADRVDYYENDWSLVDFASPFQQVGGITCYDLGGDGGPGFGVVEESNGLVRAIQVEAGDDGDVVEAREWAPGTLTAEQLAALNVDDIPVADLPGGIEIPACDS